MNEQIRDLAFAAVRNTPVANFSIADTEHALREELRKVAGDMNAFRKNKYDIFELIEQVVDDVLPERVIQIYEQFAEVRQIGQGNKATFKKKLGRKRAKSFITRVSPAGTYEAFRLDAEQFEVSTYAVGAAATIDWERYLDGSDDMADLVDIIIEGLEEAVYKAIYNQLIAVYTNIAMPSANKAAFAGFDQDSMDRLITVVKSYGDGAVIFCSSLFASKMSNEIESKYIPEADKNDIRNQGYIGLYKGTPVVILPIATEDEQNTKWAYDPSFCFILPTGGDKVVKVVLEGDLQMTDFQNPNWSMEIQFYKKFGTAVLVYNNIAIYKNTELSTDVLPSA